MNVNHEKFKCNIDIVNHKSALVRPKGVHKYFETEDKNTIWWDLYRDPLFKNSFFSSFSSR